MCIVTFELGDVVTAKSGGPKMTVEQIEFQAVLTLWFDGANLKRASFRPEALEHIDVSERVVGYKFFTPPNTSTISSAAFPDGVQIRS